jgi:hypothetical protein
MMVAENYESICYFPELLTVSYPHRGEEDVNWDSYVLTDLKATFRDVLACDVAGRVYHCDLNYSQTLKPYDPKTQAVIGSGHKLYVGRSLHLFLDTILSPQNCELLPDSIPTGLGEDGESEELPEMETLSDNTFSIKLCDTYGEPHYVSNPQELKSRLPILVVFNQSERRLAGEFPGFNY